DGLTRVLDGLLDGGAGRRAGRERRHLGPVARGVWIVEVARRVNDHGVSHRALVSTRRGSAVSVSVMPVSRHALAHPPGGCGSRPRPSGDSRVGAHVPASRGGASLDYSSIPERPRLDNGSRRHLKGPDTTPYTCCEPQAHNRYRKTLLTIPDDQHGGH